ncbi:Ig-like domain-containing protein [Peribacillus glennii]|nr:Ig-like domain-containing protein [Peribacillus glennii]
MLKRMVVLATVSVLVGFPVDVYGDEQMAKNVRVVESAGAQNYLLISNESAMAENMQEIGNFAPDNKDITMNKSLKPQAYKMDINRPYLIKPALRKSVKQASVKSVYKVGSTKPFWVTDFTTERDYSITAELSYRGSKTNVWVHDKQITQQEAEQMGREFDNNIHGLIAENFGSESDVDSNGKVDILCYDIQDGFDGKGGFFAGYFYARDLYNVSNSNKAEVFYIDTYPLMGMGADKDVTQAYSTLAHEFQHMVNFNRNVFEENTGDRMDVWLDEALAMAAEHMYTGEALTDRIDYYNQSKSIENGHSLLRWDYDGDVLSNYALSYLFGQYLKLQSNQGDGIFKEIIEDPNNDYRAVEKAAKKYIDPSMNFGQLLTSFRGALLVNEDEGIYGFKGNPLFGRLKPKIYSGGSNPRLFGGGSIVTQVGSLPEEPVAKGSDISYTFFTSEALSNEAPPIPMTLSVNKVSDKDTFLKGKTLANAKISIKTDSSTIGTGYASISGDFTIKIPKQKRGTKLTVIAEEKARSESRVVTVTVVDETPPPKPTVMPVDDNDTIVRGKAEPGSYVWVQVGDNWVNNGTQAGPGGDFSVKIRPQKARTFIAVCAVDPDGNQGSFTELFVRDKTPPKILSVFPLNGQSKTITGKTEGRALVEVKLGSKLLGKTYADSRGYYKIAINAHKKGTKLTISAYDAAKNRKSVTATIK